MRFLSQKAVKGQAMTDSLAEHPDPRATELYEDLPDEVAEVCQTQTSFERQVWQLFFNGASRIGPQGHVIAGALLPTELCDSSSFLINRTLLQ